ncbi:MAG: glycosyltransferase [Bacteroidales bacterium]|nr:glycosyltransferase [Candidatus Colimorpha onthohippi]
MKNILLITNIYPNNDPKYSGTPVCHYFAREWVGMGHNVRVIHFDSLFPRPYYWVGKLFNSFLQAQTGYVVYTDTPQSPISYQVDGVPVTFVPLPKVLPHSSPSNKVMNKAFRYVVNKLDADSFVPDVIVGHFVLPQLRFLHMFKQQYPNVRTALVLHSGGESIRSCYKDLASVYMQSVDVWGFRSVAFQKQFESLYGKQSNEFLCYSGIPSRYLECERNTHPGAVRKFVFVGSLFELKRVDDTINALNIAFPNKDFEFHIVGSGAEEKKLRGLVAKLGLECQVFFYGQQKRDDAQRIMAGCDCFVMVSEHEAFGLVYVEAMAKGLITIATIGQGMDGIITNGVNGFLCEAKSPERLANTIRRIAGMSVADLDMVSRNAYDTAKNLTNSKVAESYLNAIL